MLKKLYSHILAWKIDQTMRNPLFVDSRRKTVARARGVVLEIGFGSGLNIPFYPPTTTKLYALEPSKDLLKKAQQVISSSPFPIEQLCTGAEHIPLPTNSVDTAVSTWTLCSVTNPQETLREIARVLKPGGMFYFREHGRSPKRFWAFIQDLLTPATALCDGNCHLNRDIESLVHNSGLLIDSFVQDVPEPTRPLAVDCSGVARKK